MACVCHKGRVRGSNEDNFYFAGEMLEEGNKGLDAVLYCECPLERERETIAIFDGMGGEVGGEAAAFAAASALAAILATQQPPQCPQVLNQMNQAVYQAGVDRHMQSAGCTAVLAHFSGGDVTVANVGDSPAFLFRDGRLEKLSRDDTDAELLRELGVTNRKPRLTQYLGMDPEELDLEPHIVTRSLRGGDILLLCSDGLTDMVGPRELSTQLGVGEDAENLARDLLKSALSYGGRDNVTIMVAVVSG